MVAVLIPNNGSTYSLTYLYKIAKTKRTSFGSAMLLLNPGQIEFERFYFIRPSQGRSRRMIISSLDVNYFRYNYNVQS